MNWEAIGAVGQMLGSVAVLVTLGYLSMQIGQVRSQMAREASQARWDALRELMLTTVANPDFCELTAKIVEKFAQRAGVADYSNAWQNQLRDDIGCTPAEVFRYSSMMWVRWFYREQGIVCASDLTPGQRTQFDHAIRAELSFGTPARAWYEAHKPVLNPDAVRYIDNLLAQPG